MNRHKYWLLLPLLLFFQVGAWAQNAAASSPAPSDQFERIMTWVLVAIAATVFVAAQLYMIRVNQFLTKRVLRHEAKAHGIVLPEESVAVQGPVENSFWTKIRKKYWEDAVPIDREADIMMHHDYDGIRELDNSLPPWWINLFYITIVFAGIYMYYYHWGGSGPSSKQEYEQQVEVAAQAKVLALSRMANAVDESNVTVVADASRISEGELVYKANCAACHGQLGEGGVGPNMTDEYWVHGGGIKNVFKTIKYGVPEKGMIAWASQLNPAAMQNVASYILTLKGTNPPNGKAPQGEVWKETETPTETAPTTK